MDQEKKNALENRELNNISADKERFRNIEKELKFSEELFNTMANNIAPLAWMADPSGSLFWFSRRWFDYTGTTLEEVKGWGWTKVHHPEHVERVVKKIKHSWETGEPWEDTFPLKGKNGEYRWFLSRALPVRDEHGNILRWFGTNTDVTDLQKAEFALMESQAKLLDAQKLAHVGSFSYDISNNTTEWTDEVYRIFGRDPALGHPTTEEIMNYVHPADRPYVEECLRKAAVDKNEFEMQYRIVLADSTVKYLRYIGKPSFDSKGNLERRFGAVMDITETKTAQMRLEETLKELERSNRELEQFAYAASHDLQEPLRMMRGFSDLLRKRFSEQITDPKMLEFLGFITAGADRMQALISDLLQFSRVTTRGREFKPVSLERVLENVKSNIQFSANESQAEIFHESLPVVKADETQMVQLLQNLLSNAIKFRSEMPPQIRIRCSDLGSEWQISVSDNGIGIDPQYSDRIFVIFQRLHEREKYPGTGIGLALCKKIVERHGGRIWVESAEGPGASFHFTLPKL